MINKKSIEKVQQATFVELFCRPLYGSYCFSEIPFLIKSLFTDKAEGQEQELVSKGPFKKVVLFFLDGFGWRFYETYKNELQALQIFAKEGRVSKLTSMFPSTTAAHTTCIHTGLSPAQSGIYEWNLYEPIVDRIISPLNFSFAGEHKTDTLPIAPQELFPRETFYQKLEKEGIASHCFSPKSIVQTIYSQTMQKGATVHPYRDFKEGISSLLSKLNHPAYFYFYFSDIDSIGHRKGIHSKEIHSCIKAVFLEIERFLANIPPQTAVLLCADHGMVEVSPKSTYYINERIPHMEKFLKRGRGKELLVPAGSCRDFFLHVEEDCLKDCQEILHHFLKGKARVFLVKELLDEGFFGKKRVSEALRKRIGNLVILPFEGEAIWWRKKGRFTQNFHGAHGGLTRGEMEIPLLFISS